MSRIASFLRTSKNFLFLNIIFCSMFHGNFIDAKFIPHHIGYSIPEEKIVTKIPDKDLDFAYIIPGDNNTYIYRREADYYEGYQRAYYGLTKKKTGWDCLRHYEILANGCIPYFLDLDQCEPNTMYFMPKDLILEAMHLEGVSYMQIDHSKFNRERYFEILDLLLKHTREHLTCRKMALHLLNTMNYSGQGKILVLCQDTAAEYLRDLILIGLKQQFQNRIVDFPKIDHIYQNCTQNLDNIYGLGFSYTKIVPDLEVDRANIAERISNKEFDMIIYGEIHKGGLPFYDLVKEKYGMNEIAYIYCEENPGIFCSYDLPNLFIREYCLHIASTLNCIPYNR
jgi:hypothetical protein